jgi:RNA polymerase sigma-70 factor (sigma-E family)
MADLRTFEESFGHLYRAGYRAAYRVTGDRGASEDAASEALIRAGVRWHRIRGRELPWVVRVATNLAIDHTRRQARVLPATGAEREERGAEAVYGEIDLYRALRSLPKRQREVVVLRYFGDLSEHHIARELGISEGTVKSHASRGLAGLRRFLEPCPVPAELRREDHP